ncbi:MAG: DUF971 domain-containing protein [Verrucomicrobiota bacterium]
MITPTDIQTIGDEIAIKWNDGRESFYKMEHLRALSPSAENVGEQDLLGNVHGGTSQTDFPGVTVSGWNIVGNYAVQFVFSDNHSTGIYAFDYLRRIDEQASNSG